MSKTMTPPATPAREEMTTAEVAKRSSWKASRKSSSKITPRESSPKKLSAEKIEPSSPPRLSVGSDRNEELADENSKLVGAKDALPVSPPCDSDEAVHDNGELQDTPDVAKPAAAVPRRREIPLAFVEAFARDEEAVADSPHMGPYLLKLAKSYATGENPVKALEYCIRAVKFYEHHSQRENVLDLVISLHILAALHCHLGQYEDALALLERSLTLSDLESGGEEHFLAAFSGHMQMGDTFNMVGKLAPSLKSYHLALDIQKSVLGEFDARVAETCLYIAEAHMQVSPPSLAHIYPYYLVSSARIGHFELRFSADIVQKLYVFTAMETFGLECRRGVLNTHLLNILPLCQAPLVFSARIGHFEPRVSLEMGQKLYMSIHLHNHGKTWVRIQTWCFFELT